MELLAYILAMETNDEILKELLMELFSKDERDMIWQRLKIVTLLKKKIPQYEIAKILNASLCSITRGAKELKKPNSALSTIVDKYLINNEEVMGRIMTRCTKASTMMTNLVANDFLKEEILVPALDEQTEIGKYLDHIDNLITLHRRAYYNKKGGLTNVHNDNQQHYAIL